MDPLVARILSYLTEEWHVIRRAPGALLLIMLITGGATWYTTSKYYEALYEETLRTTEQRRAYAQDQLDQLKSQSGKSSQQQARPYTISKEDEVDFIQTLATAERHDVQIEYLSGDTKALTLAKRIASLLESSGWNVQQLNTTVVGGSPPTGVYIQTSKENGIPHGAALLQALLKKRNIETQILGYGPGEGSPLLLKIFVGPDPQSLPTE